MSDAADSNKTISFVIPVYRNEGSLKLTYEGIVRLFEAELKTFLCEFVFVDDGSDDGSLKELLQMRDADKRVKVISFSRNFGQVAAVIAGFKEALGDWVVTLSADLQDSPEMLLKMVESWQGGHEVVVCYRQEREDSFIARASSKIFYGLISRSLPNMPSGGFDYVGVSRRAVDELNKIDERNRFFQGDLLWLGYPTAFIPYKRKKRTIGKSQWSLKKKLKYFIDGLLNTSYMPIRYMSLMGIITAFLGLLYAVVIIVGYFFQQTPFSGWAPIMVVLLFLGGMIMFMLGVIGEYIWRIYDETRDRPIYIVKDRFF